jgi:hypothetical protein
MVSIATLWVAMSFSTRITSAGNKGKLKITFINYVGDKKLKLDSATYKNELGQDFTVTNFKYYVGNFRLKRNDGTEYISEESFLVKEDDELSKQITLNDVPAGVYSSIEFIVGVDSIHNCSGAQSGALDPANGMFWTWNTGYIFMKLEGKSPASNSPGHIFEFHIGGYKAPANCIRKVTLSLNGRISFKQNPDYLYINVDASEVMKSPTTIDLSKLSSVTDFRNATTIADNYADMFRLPSLIQFQPIQKLK